MKWFSAVALGIMAVGALAIWVLRPAIESRLVGVHQRSVTRSLAQWAGEDSKITNDASAIHAAEMVGYVSRYYLPGEGYRGPAEVEAALEAQRRQTIEQLVSSLQRHTGLAYGTNVEHWTEWAQQQRGAAANTTSNEPDGAASRSQPIRSETNRTTAAAGSDRRPLR
jgi:hypothetical protein